MKENNKNQLYFRCLLQFEGFIILVVGNLEDNYLKALHGCM